MGCLLLLATIAQTGCYLGHLAAGQARVMWARESIDDVLAEPTTPETVRTSLSLVDEVRAFAAGLGLDVGQQYRSYVDWDGDRILTTVVATEPGRIESRPFRFPLIGDVPYKGFFDRARAEREAESLRDQGLDVCLVAVPAYSTLGWLADPVTRPMLRGGPGPLVETLLHELVHATVFVKSQPDFNEGAASFFGEEASIRFFAERDRTRAAAERDRVADGRAVDREVVRLRDAIRRVYETDVGVDERAAARAQAEAEARARMAGLALRTREAGPLAARLRLNDACIALRGTYVGDLDRHARVLQQLGGDLGAYLTRLRAAAEAPDPRAAFFARSPRDEAAP
ncbi:MAG: aminopeptidase [Proteobacteria bacterium]|nr:aminopeptidase [Pseudomonadota bacterium]